MPFAQRGCANGRRVRALSQRRALHRRARKSILLVRADKYGVPVKFKLILFGLSLLFRYARWRSAKFRDRLAQRDLTVVLRTADGDVGRTYVFAGGGVTSRAGVDPKADLSAAIVDVQQLSSKALMAFEILILHNKILRV